MTTRAFVAVDLAPAVQAAAERLIGLLQMTEADVRWVTAEQMHLTLNFLGDVTDVQIVEICRAVERACQEHPPFSLEVRGAGAFPRVERPRTLWLGVGDGLEPLRALQESLTEHLKPCGYRPERRRYQPHLTIGRVRSFARKELPQLMALQADFEAGVSLIDEVKLYASYLDRSGPTYKVMHHVPLAAAEG